MPRDKRYRSGSAAVGGGLLALWLTMRCAAWLEQEWLPLLPPTAAAAVGLLLQLVMLGLPLAVILWLLRCPAALLCPMGKGERGSLWLLPAGWAVLVAAIWRIRVIQNRVKPACTISTLWKRFRQIPHAVPTAFRKDFLPPRTE